MCLYVAQAYFASAPYLQSPDLLDPMGDLVGFKLTLGIWAFLHWLLIELSFL